MVHIRSITLRSLAGDLIISKQMEACAFRCGVVIFLVANLFV